MLNQFSSVKLKPGYSQMAGGNIAADLGPDSCILGLYKHRLWRRYLLLAFLHQNRKCCSFLYLICSAHKLTMMDTASSKDLRWEGPAASSAQCPPVDCMVLSHWKHFPNPFENDLSFAMPWLESHWVETSSNFPMKRFSQLLHSSSLHLFHSAVTIKSMWSSSWLGLPGVPLIKWVLATWPTEMPLKAVSEGGSCLAWERLEFKQWKQPRPLSRFCL